MKYYKSIIELIGSTPLIRLNKIEKKYKLNYKIFAKLEKYNASGSIKDRIAFNMISNALKKGVINKNTLIIEPTSGNTGIGLALICAYYNLKLHIYMPSSFSVERIKMMEFYGAEVFLTDKKLGMKGAIDKAIEEHKLVNDSFIPFQFSNKDNINAHYLYTAKELLNDLDNKIDVLISGIGTGGTIMGISKRFKKEKVNCKIIGVEPFESPLLSQNRSNSHKIEGIGANFIPPLIDMKYINEIKTASFDESFECVKELALEEGLFVGISSGAVLNVSLKLDKNKYKNKNVVLIFPDGGEKYLSIYG